MAMRLREFGAIRKGNTLIVPCLGRNKDGSPHCCGIVAAPFDPPLPGCPKATPTEQGFWVREGGDDIDTLTLKQSVQAGACGHFAIKSGDLIPLP